MTAVIAHRTCPRDAPENSLAGIEAARRLGADVVEVDARCTRDGIPVLLHDGWLLRTTGWPRRIGSVDAAWATRRRLIGGGRLPTLEDALRTLGDDLMMAIDVKDAGAGPAVVEVVDRLGCADRVLFWSQHEEALVAAAQSGLSFERSLLRDTSTSAELDRFLADADRLGVGGISAHWSQVDTALAEACRARSVRLYAWCKRERIDTDKLALLDGLVTDWPAAGRAALSGR